MPAPVLKFQIIFEEDSGYGWTEIHFKQASGENPNLGVQLDNFNASVVAARRLILGNGDNVVGSRVSYPRAGAIASLAARFFLPGEGTQPGSAPSVSLAMQMQNADGTRHKIIHLRGFWDAVEHDGGYDPAGVPPAPDWQPRLTAYKDTLVAGAYGWLTKDAATSSQGNVTGYVVGADTRITFTVLPLTNPLPAVGTILQVRFSKLNNSRSALNRSLLVEVTGANTMKTVNQVAAAPFAAPGRYNMRLTAFVAYSAVGSISLGERRMGKPLNRYPGRSKARATA